MSKEKKPKIKGYRGSVYRDMQTGITWEHNGCGWVQRGYIRLPPDDFGNVGDVVESGNGSIEYHKFNVGWRKVEK